MMIRAEQLERRRLAESERERIKGRAWYRVGIGVLGCGVDTYFERESSAAHLRTRYRDLPSDSGTLQTYVACDDSGATYFLQNGNAYYWPHGALSDRATAFLADAVVTDALLRAIPACVSLHAAALRHAGIAFAITGLSTAGKTTTAIACAAAGCELYSDERCVVTPAGVIPYPRTLNIRAAALDLLCRDLPETDVQQSLCAHRGMRWRDVSFTELFGVRAFPKPAPLRALFTIRGYDTQPRTRRISALEILPEAKVGARSRAPGIERIGALMEALSNAACFELILGPPFTTARHIRGVVESVAP